MADKKTIKPERQAREKPPIELSDDQLDEARGGGCPVAPEPTVAISPDVIDPASRPGTTRAR